MTASKGNGMRVKSIGHYTLSKTIGEGTFGKVKLGTHILTGEKVAVKILEKERIADVADVERVAREIKILKLVQHPHVIQLYEIIETPKQLYLIMEFCCGGELFDYIVAQGRVQEHEACRFFHQILAGVEQIHGMNVVHRDLKPENLLFDDEQNIKIVDFGLSNTFEDGQLLKTACGSPCYAAPEMIAGHRYVPARCDVWSCGVILFALVCGYLPFEDQNTSALYRKILDADYQAPKFISDGVRDLITRMLTTDPELRITIPRIRNHSWYQQIPEASRRWIGANEERDLDNEVLEHLECLDFQRNYAVKCLQMGKHNHLTTTYYLLREKKRRMGGYLEDPHRQFDESDSGYVVGQNDSASGSAAKHGHDTPPGAKSVPAADADRAAGSGPAEAPSAPRSPRYSRGSEPSQPPHSARPYYGAAAEALGMPRGQLAHAADAASRGSAGEAPASARDWRPRSSASSTSDPLAELQASRPPHAAGPAHAAVALPSRVGALPRRQGESQSTPRGAASPAQTTLWRRSPFQQSTGIATPITPRGATSQSPTPRAVPLAPAPRSRTPGKRVAGEPLSAREPMGRPGSSQRAAAPTRPMAPTRPTVPASTRNQTCDVRRRHYTAATPLDAAKISTSGPRTAAASVAADLYGEDVPGGVTSRSVGVPRMSAWPSRPQGTTIRASSASPELVSDTGGGLTSREPVGVEAMRTCRGAFNVSCTTSKAPKQIMQEMHRALALLRVVFKQTSSFLLKCQKQSLRFEMEVSHLDHLESIYVVRFRRVAGDLAAYKEQCAKILAEMKM